MDTVIERELVGAFFARNFTDRLLHELFSDKKRNRFFDKIAHTAERYLKSDAVVEKSKMPLTQEEISRFLFGANDGQCYVIAYRSELDGCFAQLSEVVLRLYSCGAPYMLYAPGRGTAYLECEYDHSCHISYLLKKCQEMSL